MKAIIPIHYSMHRVVHSHKVQARRGLGNVRVPAVQQDGDVVVPVQSDEFAFAKHDEESVQELWHL